MTFRELCSKEVVQLKDGACLGRVDDVELDADTARIGSLLLLGRPRLFGLLGRDETLTIPWADIERIGLTPSSCGTDHPRPAAPPHGDLAKLASVAERMKDFTRFLSVRAGFWRRDDYNRGLGRSLPPQISFK